MTGQSKQWVFTINNWTNVERRRLRELVNDGLAKWVVIGFERGDSGTPHIQGAVLFHSRKRLNQVKNTVGQRAHVERMAGTIQQARSYCIKDGSYEEFGDPPVNASGNAGQFANFRDWVLGYHGDHGHPPSERAIANAFPALFVRYSRALLALSSHLCPLPELQTGNLHEWQLALEFDLESPADDRSVLFYVDEVGGKGKSWIQRYFATSKPDEVQLLSIGKRDDIAHAIDPNKSIFLFNVPRGGMEFLQYTMLEMLKDRVVFSPKYNSTTKYLTKCPHVVVFCNEFPDLNKMTYDRYEIRDLNNIAL